MIVAIALLLFCCWWQSLSKKKAVGLAASEVFTKNMKSIAYIAKGYHTPELDANDAQKSSVIIHEVDGTKTDLPAELEEHELYELEGEDGQGEISSPVASDGRNPQFSWVRRESGSVISGTATPGTETMSSMSSGWEAQVRVGTTFIILPC